MSSIWKVDELGFEPWSEPARRIMGMVDGGHGVHCLAWTPSAMSGAQVAELLDDRHDCLRATTVVGVKSGAESSATLALPGQKRGRDVRAQALSRGIRAPRPAEERHGLKGDDELEVRAVDAAGNADATPAVHAWKIETAVIKAAQSALMAPRTGARVTRPPLLVWRRANRARYYNVQVYRGRRKVLTAWPTKTRFQLQTRWKNLGRKEQLLPGSYRWYVWPGYGAPSARRYGQLLGQSTFVIARRSGR